ncbi:hypothetical protein U1Q18_023355 [Sarracenia purpurea var. burkii]
MTRMIHHSLFWQRTIERFVPTVVVAAEEISHRRNLTLFGEAIARKESSLIDRDVHLIAVPINVKVSIMATFLSGMGSDHLPSFHLSFTLT